MSMHTLQYLSILKGLIAAEEAYYNLQVLTFFNASYDLLDDIKINRHGILRVTFHEKLFNKTLEKFQEEFALKLKDIRKINRYNDDEAIVLYEYYFQKVNYLEDNVAFWKDNSQGKLSNQLKNYLSHLHKPVE